VTTDDTDFIPMASRVADWQQRYADWQRNGGVDEALRILEKLATPRRRRRPSIRKMIAEAEKSGKTVTSVTTPDGSTLTFGELSTSPAASSGNPWDEVLSRDTH
jgi:hypothetical protein